MGDLTQVQLLPVESGTAKRGEPDLTDQEIALIVTAGRPICGVVAEDSRQDGNRDPIRFATNRDNARAPHVTVQRCGRPRTHCQIR